MHPQLQASDLHWRGSTVTRMPPKPNVRALVRDVGRVVLRAPSAARRWTAMPAAERRQTLRALVVLFVLELTIRWIPVPRVAHRLGVTLDGEDEGVADSDALAPDALRAAATGAAAAYAPHLLTATEQQARRSTFRVIRRWPFGLGPCLRESLVLGHLLRDHSPVLRFGVTRDHGSILAHAWLEVAGRPINDPAGVLPFQGAPR